MSNGNGRRKVTAIETFNMRAFLLDEAGRRIDYENKAAMEADVEEKKIKVDIECYFGSPLARLIKEDGKEA